MISFKRAWISLKRLAVKSVILFLLIFLMGALLSGALLARNAINEIEDNLMKRLPSIVEPLPRIAGASDLWVEQIILMDNQLTAEIVQELGSWPEVRTYDFTLTTTVWSLDLEPGISTWLTQNVPNSSHHFHLIGSNNHLITGIESEMLELVVGRTFTPEEMHSDAHLAIVPHAFAQANDLSIGSTFEISDSVSDLPKLLEKGAIASYLHLEEYMLAHQTLEFEIIGIFDLAIPIDMADLDMLMRDQMERTLTSIYVPLQILENIHEFRYELLPQLLDEWAELGLLGLIASVLPQSEAIFILESARYFEAFNERASNLLPDYWELMDNSGLTVRILDSMTIMRDIANGILWLSSGALILILILVIWLFLYDRRRELGIYMALGATKKSIVTQISTEIGMIFLVAITLSLFVGNFVGDMISQHLTAANLTQGISRFQDRSGTWTGRQSEIVNAIWSSSRENLIIYDVSLDMKTVLLSIGIGMIVMLLALGISMFYVLRLKPKKLLM